MLHSLRLRNFRGFSDDLQSPFVDIKPLTLLIGKNSSGKSSFLRAFPLLRQSVESKMSGPVLWYGRDVDFGDISTVKNKNLSSDTIYFDFRVIVDFGGGGIRNTAFKRSGLTGKERRSKVPVQLSMGVSAHDKKTIVKNLVMSFLGFQYEFVFHDNKCSFYIDQKSIGEFEFFESHLFPFEFFFTKDASIYDGISYSELSKRFIDSYIERKYSRKFINYFNTVLMIQDPAALLAEINYMRDQDVDRFLRSRYNFAFTNPAEERKYQIKCEELARFSFDKNISGVVCAIRNEIVNIFKAVRYTMPLRASGERYYRFQDLQVEEMDPAGRNLAMMLRSFAEYQRKSFSKWTKENFGFGVEVKEVDLHCEILIDIDSKKYNMSDMGFGFSQLMPILASLWYEALEKGGRGARTPLIFAIEQPELHLHPEYQAKVAKIFASIIKFSSNEIGGRRVSIVIETHSKAMIDSIGDSIKQGTLSKNEVSIVLFEREQSTGFSTIRKSSYDDNGYLLDWPIGFFSGR